MEYIDWAIVVLYVVFATVIGLWFTSRASQSKEDFFVAGRSLPWFVAGTSMVATTFSADTPLFVSGIVREEGIYANWIWWGGMVGILISVFFFSRLWRRSEAVTEIEFVSQRYEHSLIVDILRVFRALFDGVLVNCIIMASVTLAMSKIIVVILGIPEDAVLSIPLIGDVNPLYVLLIGLAVIAVAYTALSGLYGVVYTDLIQFVLAMVGGIALAAVVWLDLESSGGFIKQIKSAPGFTDNTLNLFPIFGFNLETLTFFVYILILPLYSAVGPGFFLQRILACKTERDAALSMVWFSICHMILRSWPWIIVAVASLVYFPVMADGEQTYPAMLNQLLPVGLKGIMVASLLAAFMSTLDTHLNWGSSYLLNDIYQPFIAKNKTSKHYVAAGRLLMLFLAVCALLVSTQLTSILNAYKYIGMMIIGPSVILILRWYWWRINAWSEVSVFIASLIFGNLLAFWLPDTDAANYYGVRALLNMFIATSIALIVTYLTSSAEPEAKAISFYKKMRIQGPGWNAVRAMTGVSSLDNALSQTALSCLGAIGALFGLMFMIGNLIFENYFGLVVSIAVFIPSAFVCAYYFNNLFGSRD